MLARYAAVVLALILDLCLLFIHPRAPNLIGLQSAGCAFYLFIRQPHGSEVSSAARNTLDSARIPRASKLLICGLFQKGRVLAQDGVHWYNTQRLLEPIGNVSPVEYEMNYYRSQEGSLEMARLN